MRFLVWFLYCCYCLCPYLFYLLSLWLVWHSFAAEYATHGFLFFLFCGTDVLLCVCVATILIRFNLNSTSECLTVREAFDMYTLGGAYAAMQEHRLGRLLPGYQADFVVLDKDVCSSPTDLLSAKVLEVWVAGQRKL